jgi:hypothetical protein
MWSSWVNEKGTTQVMYVAKLKDGPKRVKKTSSMILERVFEMVWWRGKTGITSKRIFKVEVFFFSQNIDFPFYSKGLLELSFFLLFYFLFFSCFISRGLKDDFDDDGPKRVKKTSSMILERVFEMVWWRGETGITSKTIFEVKVFFFSQNIDFPFYSKGLLELFFFLLFFLIFFILHLWRTLRFWWYLSRKSLLQKLLFIWPQYTGGGRIFQNGVMHASMAKLWLWRWGSCGYTGSGRIFRSVDIQDNIFGWV